MTHNDDSYCAWRHKREKWTFFVQNQCKLSKIKPMSNMTHYSSFMSHNWVISQKLIMKKRKYALISHAVSVQNCTGQSLEAEIMAGKNKNKPSITREFDSFTCHNTFWLMRLLFGKKNYWFLSIFFQWAAVFGVKPGLFSDKLWFNKFETFSVFYSK